MYDSYTSYIHATSMWRAIVRESTLPLPPLPDKQKDLPDTLHEKSSSGFPHFAREIARILTRFTAKGQLYE